MHNTPELVKHAIERWNLSTNIIKELKIRIQDSNDIVTLPKDELLAFFDSIIVDNQENLDLLESIAQTVAEYDGKTINISDAITAIQEGFSEAEKLSLLPVEFIESIGKSDEFLKYCKSHT